MYLILDLAPSPTHPQLFLDVAGFFVCLVLTEYILRFEPHVGHSEGFNALEMYSLFIIIALSYVYATLDSSMQLIT